MHPIDPDVLLSELPLDYFTGLATFGALSEEAVDWLLRNGSIVRLDEGEILFEAGDRVDEFYIVLTGCLSSFRPLQTQLVLTRLCGAGEHVGFSAMIALHDRYSTAIAKQDSILLEISSSQFYQMHEVRSQAFGILLLNLTRELARNVGALGDKITKLSETLLS
ncbi:cyclic nucleotide-binding domain-containing protein [Pontibacterium sp. N1Y112]|uniref:Cyclic nucleotide-binding domain-containing protein n=1 Tax=Pontibacterium sinense TaxID=2781979 RepID=A0A8J7FCD8_9GAMM|nr:cyclic nucleotide-binding domain-containing protein [Pontibacterium sinense]MBE9398950.1 cyclic nucleotide-binding domain-containing protein [Pontibacterium sinense]